MKTLNIIALMYCTLFYATLTHAGTSVPYPTEYRQWTHVKSMLIQPQHPLANPFQGIHHIYANPKALKGLNGGRFEDGAVLVFDLLDYNETGHAVQEGERKLIGVMLKNSKQYRDTGGWGFEGFAADSQTKRLVNDGGQSCFACHQSQQKNSYVFTQPRP